MSNINPTAGSSRPKPLLGVTLFDQVRSTLMSCFFFFGNVVFFMFLIWLLDQWDFRGGEVIVEFVDRSGRGLNAEGLERDFDPPGLEEVEEITEPTLADALQAVTEAVSTVAATLDSINADVVAMTQGAAVGDSRPPGPDREGEEIVAAHERWRLKFQAKGIQPYSQQLDFYQIELGAIGGSVQGVDYASNLSSEPRKRFVKDTSVEQRLYFRFTEHNAMQRWDKQLLGKAGVNTGPGRYVMKFIPKKLEKKLTRLELDYAATKGVDSLTKIARTTFQSQPARGGYQFVVIEQRYRK